MNKQDMIKFMREMANELDQIKFDLYGSVYSLEDSEYARVYMVRDTLFEKVEELKRELNDT